MRQKLSTLVEGSFFGLLALSLSAVLTVSCASVGNYDAAGKRIGFEHYAGKHYLLIEEGTGGIKTFRILTLPDFSKPRYVKRKSGWGGLEFSFKLENGVLTEFGAASDSQGAATLATLGTLGTAAGAVLAAKATAAGALAVANVTAAAGAGAAPGAPPPSVTIESLNDVANQLQVSVVTPLNAAMDPTLVAVRTSVGSAVGSLRTAADLDPGKNLVDEIAKAQKTVAKLATALEVEEGKLTLFLEGLKNPTMRSTVTQVTVALGVEIAKLKGFAQSSKLPALYEVLPRRHPTDPDKVIGIDFRPVNLD